ncbi:hypothetical protein COFA105466_04805 [Corynebacterium falsenii]
MACISDQLGITLFSANADLPEEMLVASSHTLNASTEVENKGIEGHDG